MKKPRKMTSEEIDRKIATSLKFHNRAKELEKTDFYQINEVALESRHCGNAMDCASIASGYCLKEDYEQARHYFKLAAEFKIKPFQMAYDKEYPDYVGDNIYEGVRDINAIAGFNWAMCAGELKLASQFCHYYCYVESDDFGDMTYSYVLALQYLFKGDARKAGIYCQKSLEEFKQKPDKGITYRSNYFTLHLALLGILTGDQEMLEEGINKQLQICYQDAIYGEFAGLTKTRISDFSVALVNLSLIQGMEQTVFDDFIPQGLIKNPAIGDEEA